MGGTELIGQMAHFVYAIWRIFGDRLRRTPLARDSVSGARAPNRETSSTSGSSPSVAQMLSDALHLERKGGCCAPRRQLEQRHLHLGSLAGQLVAVAQRTSACAKGGKYVGHACLRHAH